VKVLSGGEVDCRESEVLPGHGAVGRRRDLAQFCALVDLSTRSKLSPV
jgi:hypothetical protein